MKKARRAALRAALIAALVAPLPLRASGPGGALEPEPALLVADGECEGPPGDAGGCALSALQLRGASLQRQQGAELAAPGLSAHEAATPAPSAAGGPKAPLRILFVGNSFTYGPHAYGDKNTLNNLPRMFKLVAESLGHKVQQAEDTVGGCTLFMHKPSYNPEACTNPEFCARVQLPRVNDTEDCTFRSGVKLGKAMGPCPQRLLRNEFGGWDVVVLQEASFLPTLAGARERMMRPAVNEFAEVVTHLNVQARKRKPLIALYMTWAYYNGSNSRCPGRGKRGCWPVAPASELVDCEGDRWYKKVATVPCQGYALARGVAKALDYGGDVLIPAGLAWQAARGSPAIPDECKALIDAEYEEPGHLASLDLPLKVKDPAHARWTGQQAQRLFRNMGPGYKSKYCKDGCHIDHHPSTTGMYLNALVFFATLFKSSPIGAAYPDGKTSVDGIVLPAVKREDAEALQHIAHDVVMDHMGVWWRGGTGEPLGQDPCVPGISC